MEAEAIDKDVILIVGTQSREQKFHQTTLFLNPSSTYQSTNLSFDARGCFTTRAMGSAGWDDHGPIIFTGLEARYKKSGSNTCKVSRMKRQTMYQE
jgi:hypothetical protein